MMSKGRTMLRNERGVTLIELLAVVVILGIIAAIAAPNILDNFRTAKVNSDEATERILKNASMQYVMQHEGGFADLDSDDNNDVIEVTVSDLYDEGLIEQDSLSWGDGQGITHVEIAKKSTGGYVYTMDPERPTDY